MLIRQGVVMIKHQRGMTLIELMIATVVMGVLMSIAGGFFAQYRSAEIASYRKEQEMVNFKIVAAMKMYAFDQNAGRTLGSVTYDEYSNSAVHLTSTDASWVMMRQYFVDQGILASQAAHDGRGARVLKVMQQIERDAAIPISGSVGETVTIRYDAGVVYQTDCQALEPCNDDGFMGDSAQLTAANYDTYILGGTDFGAAPFSTADVQREFWGLTYSRIQTVLGKLELKYATEKLTSDAEQVTDNFYPLPGNVDAPDLSGVNDQFCRNGWYALNAANVDVLDQLGLAKSEYGVTAWGGNIEYCQDFDPAQEGANTGVHSMALRIHFDVSMGYSPSNTFVQNRFFTM